MPNVQFVHLSSGPQDVAETRTDSIGLDAVFGGLDLSAKVEALRSVSSHAIWIGDGSDLKSAPVRAAAAVTVSAAGIGALPKDVADIPLVPQGRQRDPVSSVCTSLRIEAGFTTAESALIILCLLT